MSLIVSLTAENFMRLRAVQIRPQGPGLVQLRGRNMQGKSSVLSSIFAALGGGKAVPPVPVREGEESAIVKLDMGDIVVTRTFTAEGKTTLKVDGANGVRLTSPQDVLNKLVAGLSFDPLAFTRMEKAKRDETLRKLVGLDFTQLDAERKEAYDLRTAVGREVKQVEGELAGLPFDFEAPDANVSVAALVDEVTALRQRQAEAARLESDAKRADGDVTQQRREAVSLREQAADLIKRAEAAERTAARREAVATDLRSQIAGMTVPTDEDISAVSKRIAGAENANARVRANERHEEIKLKLAAKRGRYAELDDQIAAIDAEKTRQLSSAKYPLPELRLGGDGVMLAGMPWEQASQAQQLRASVAIGMALSPTLRILLVRDGSVLDDDAVAILAEMAETHGFQVWLERVSNERAGPGILIEDGEVVRGSEAAE